MTPNDFKLYNETITRSFLVVSAVFVFVMALWLAYIMPDHTLFVSLGTGALSLLTGVFGYWMGSSHKSPLPPDTTLLQQTPAEPKNDK